jgi:hypothetical protein
MRARLAARLALVLAAAPAGCDEGGGGPDPDCCEKVYPAWCYRYQACDPLSFGRSWRELDDCVDQQIAACRAGTDTERICTGDTASHADACMAALASAECDEVDFGAGVLPEACGGTRE